MRPKQQNNICRRFSMWNLWQKCYKHSGTKSYIVRCCITLSAACWYPVFSFTTAFLQTATSSSSLWEALPAPSNQPLRLPRYTLLTQTSSGVWQLLVSQKQRLAFIHLFVTSVAVNEGYKIFWHLLSRCTSGLFKAFRKINNTGACPSLPAHGFHSRAGATLLFPSSQRMIPLASWNIH